MKITISNQSTPPAPKEIKFPAVYEAKGIGSLYLFVNENSCILLKTGYKGCGTNFYPGKFYSGITHCNDLNTYKPRPDISVTLHAENE